MKSVAEFIRTDKLHNMPKGRVVEAGPIRIKTYYYRGIQIEDLGDDAELLEGWMYSFMLYGNSQTEESVYYDDEIKAGKRCLQISEAALSKALRAVRKRMKDRNIERL